MADFPLKMEKYMPYVSWHVRILKISEKNVQ